MALALWHLLSTIADPDHWLMHEYNGDSYPDQWMCRECRSSIDIKYNHGREIDADPNAIVHDDDCLVVLATYLLLEMQSIQGGSHDSVTEDFT